MTELQKTLNLPQKRELFKRLELAGYAFAAWRMPNTTETQLIISLNGVEKLDEFQLSELAPGFLINAFSDDHPVKPYFISADIIIRNNDWFIDPKVESSAIDTFKEAIDEVTPSRPAPSSKASDSPELVDFESAVKTAVDEIKTGQFEKVVLSRFKDERLPEEFSAWNFFQRISAKYMNAFVSMTAVPGKGTWIGATPELLLSDNSSRFKTVALAATKKLEEGKSLSEIAWTQKEIEEQAFVSRYIINCFKKIRLREFHEHGPKTIQASGLAHLKTEFVIDYNELQFENLADQMLELLHPTSAVCGMPIEHTKPWIKQVENYDREFYSGFLGPVNFDASTNLFVNLRCMKVENKQVRLYAGAGITEDSIASREFEETEMKMNVLKSKF